MKKQTVVEPVEAASQMVEALALRNAEILTWSKVGSLTVEREYTACATALVNLKEQINYAESERKKITDPLNAVIKHVNEKFGVFTKPRKALEEHMKTLLSAFMLAKRQAEAALAEKQAKKLEKDGAKQLAMDLRDRASNAVPVPAIAGITFRERWAYRVVDLAKVPREYLVVDEKKLKTLAKLGAEAPKIAGIEFYRDDRPAVGGVAEED